MQTRARVITDESRQPRARPRFRSTVVVALDLIQKQTEPRTPLVPKQPTAFAPRGSGTIPTAMGTARFTGGRTLHLVMATRALI